MIRAVGLFAALAFAVPAHAQHDPQPPVASAQAVPPVPASTAPPAPATYAADRIYDPAAMARARAILREEHGGSTFSKVIFDLAEVQAGRSGDLYRYDAEAWFGGDIDKLVVKSEGEGRFGAAPESIEAQALFAHAVGPYFDVQAGVRYDVRPDPERTYAVIGVEGLAPYWFEVEAHLFLSSKGELFGRLKAEHDMLITQRLILQPRVESDIAFQRVRALGLGSGISDIELGLRLRYEITRELAPYVGVNVERKLGGTGDLARAAGERVRNGGAVLGVRAWF